LFFSFALACFLQLFWNFTYLGYNGDYYLGEEAIDFNNNAEHIPEVYGSVFDVPSSPFDLRQKINTPGSPKKHPLLSVLINQYGVRVLHNYQDEIKRIVRVTPKYMATKATPEQRHRMRTKPLKIAFDTGRRSTCTQASSLGRLFIRSERRQLMKCMYNLKNATHLRFKQVLPGYAWVRRAIDLVKKAASQSYYHQQQ
jgi:hypothetical protein